jgi:Ras-related protein Rab-5C
MSSFQKPQPKPNPMIYSKIIFLGDRCGKTSIITRFIDDKFFDLTDKDRTTGFITKQMSLLGEEFGTHQMNYQIGDTSSDDKYQFLYKIFIKEASAVIFAFDMTNRDSFNNVKDIIDKTLSYIKQSTILLLVATKADLKDQIQVNLSEARLLASDKSMLFKEVSAKTGQGIKDLFVDLGKIEVYRITGQSNVEKKVFNKKKGV